MNAPATTPRVRLAELNRDECQAIARAGGIAVVPLGATEQHGPHLPAGTDALTVDHITTRAAEKLVGRVPIVVCPTLPYGCSHHHLQFGATGSLSIHTMLAVLTDIGDSLVSSGFRRILLVNGHGGNHDVMASALSVLAHRHPRISVACGSWWELAEDALVGARALELGDVPGHAGAFETSIVLALRPELVGILPGRRHAGDGALGMREPLKVRRPDDWATIDGYGDSPERADAAAGTAYLEAAIAALAAAIEGFATKG